MLNRSLNRIALIIALLLITPLIFSGCGKSPTAKTTRNAQDQAKLNQVQEFDGKIRPLFEAANASYSTLTSAVRRYGYSEITKDQLVAAVMKAKADTDDIVGKVEQVQAEGEYEQVKGGLSTCLYLRNQELDKLVQLVKQPKPKSSELNGILEALTATESFFNQGFEQLQSIETQVGYQPGK